MHKERVLIIDDESNMRHMLTMLLSREGYIVESAENGEQGLQCMARSQFDFILCDIKMPRMDGMSFLEKSILRYPEKIYIMMSAYGTVDTALEAMKKGAYDYISKPFKPDEVLLTLKKAGERERLKEENNDLKTKITAIEQKYAFSNIIARSESMAKVFDLVRKVSSHKTTVLITGESGTGKELIAKALHSGGNRRDKPFVAINCGGIPENLLESELFGYKRGAFTDAVKDKKGRFEEANGGTIFLDEIGEMPNFLQVKLLRVLQEEEITPLGGPSTKVDVRVIAATSKNLEEEVSAERFRSDLYYRINVMLIHLPPLRERPGDIPLLVGYFIDQFNKKLNKNIEGLSSETMPILMDYEWPGNVRELENVLERAILLATDRWLRPSEIPENIKKVKNKEENSFFISEETLSLKKAFSLLQKELIQKALKKTKGNKSQAAKLLEISRPVLLAKIKEFGLE